MDRYQKLITELRWLENEFSIGQRPGVLNILREAREAIRDLSKLIPTKDQP